MFINTNFKGILDIQKFSCKRFRRIDIVLFPVHRAARTRSSDIEKNITRSSSTPHAMRTQPVFRGSYSLQNEYPDALFAPPMVETVLNGPNHNREGFCVTSGIKNALYGVLVNTKNHHFFSLSRGSRRLKVGFSMCPHRQNDER
jgi:hypothetical protein